MHPERQGTRKQQYYGTTDNSLSQKLKLQNFLLHFYLCEIQTEMEATSITLDSRFTMLASMAPDRVANRRKRRPSGGNFMNFNNKNLIEQITRQLQQAKRQALRSRLGVGRGGLRRFGSEGSLAGGLRRSSSFGNLSTANSMKSRGSWRQSNGNLNGRTRSISFSSAGSVAGLRPRGFWRRGGGQRALRGRFRGGRQAIGRITNVSRPQRARRGVGRGGLRRGAGRGGAGQAQGAGREAGQAVGAGRGAVQARGAGRGRGRGRGGISRQTPRPVPTREELDAQLEQYMAGTKAALDKELEDYMKNAMDFE